MNENVPPKPPPTAGYLDLSGINALNAQRDLLKEQMLRAQALAQPSGQKFDTWGGALLGGLGDLFQVIGGKTQEARLASALEENRKAEQGKLGEFNTALNRPDATPEDMERLAFAGISSGHPALSATGEAALRHQDTKLRRSLERQRDESLAEERKIDNARQQAQFEETARHNKFTEDNPVPIFAYGQGGQMIQLPGRMPANAPPVGRPVTTPDNQPVIKPNEMSDTQKKGLQDAAKDVAGINLLVDSFKPEFVGGGAIAGKAAEVADALGGGGGVMGGLVGGASKALGGLDEEGIKARKNWWQKYDLLINLPQRNEVFGSSLSASEKASWAAAQDVARGTDHVAAVKALQLMQAMANEKLAGLTGSSLAEGANPGAVQSLTRVAGMQPPAAQAPPINTNIPIVEPPAPPPARKRALPKTAAKTEAASGPNGPTVTQGGVVFHWNPDTKQYE